MWKLKLFYPKYIMAISPFNQRLTGRPLKKIGLLLFCIFGLTPATLRAEEIRYGRDIRPILSDKCFFCHGSDPETREEGLRLDIREDAIKGEAFIPGKPEKSELIRLINTKDDKEIMPPVKSHKKLNDRERKLLYDWIKSGAEYEPHWAYVPPKREKKSSIDQLVLRRLAARKLGFAEPAPAHTLIRRLHFDLTGLPPTPKEVLAFAAAHKKNPQAAVAAVADQLLASPHFGERRAVQWLDLVRYADTTGYHSDQERDASPYRDYVINAFNQDMPFNQFTIEQIAGDLLPNATLSQKVGASYNRLNQISAEGGIQDIEYLAKYQAERVRTTSAAFLGSTMACCECHDHKFDPFTAKDFYSLAAFFGDILEKGAWNGDGSYQEKIDPYVKEGIKIDKWGPYLEVPDLKQVALIALADTRIKAIETEMAKDSPERNKAFAAWLSGERSKMATGKGPFDLPVIDETQPNQPSIDAKVYVNKGPAPVQSGTQSRKQVSADKLIQHIATLKKPVTIQEGDRLYAWVFLDAQQPPKSFMLQFKVKKSWEHRVYWGESVIPYGKSAGGAAYFHAGPLPALDQWVRLEIPAIDLGLPAGAVVGQTAYTQHGGLIYWDSAGITTSDASRISSHLPGDVGKFMADPKGEQTPEGRTALINHYSTIFPGNAKLQEEKKKLEAEKVSIGKSIRTVPSTVSAKRREIRLLPRGNWADKSGPIMEPATPAFLTQGTPSGTSRLDLAKWIASEENPLTARVFVNRLWGQLFGTGLTKSSGDFGYQGEYPSNPELLDWLALEFTENNWSVKHLVRTIMLSKTYQQTSTPGATLIQQDPQNRWLARQTQLRLSAEAIRDNALFLSGLLDPEVGGASAKPYQPSGYYRHMNFPKRTYKHDRGIRQYRRGLYTHWQRTFLHPMMKNFDAPAREECATGRPSSNTPLQALTLLNDPTFTEAARVLASRLLEKGDEEFIQRTFVTCLSRNASAEEHAIMKELLKEETARFTANVPDAQKFITIGLTPPPKDMEPAKLAAATSVVRTVLNLHEIITRY